MDTLVDDLSSRQKIVSYSTGSMNSGPFNNQTSFDPLNTELAPNSEPHCSCTTLNVIKIANLILNENNDLTFSMFQLQSEESLF